MFWIYRAVPYDNLILMTAALKVNKHLFCCDKSTNAKNSVCLHFIILIPRCLIALGQGNSKHKTFERMRFYPRLYRLKKHKCIHKAVLSASL